MFPTVAQRGDTILDVTPLVENPENILLVADGGGMIFICHEPGIYEVHTAFLKPDRDRSQQGPHIHNACLEAYRWMFTHTLAMTLLTRLPHHNRAAVVFAPLVGWTKQFERAANWPTIDGDVVDVTFSSMHYDDWVRKTPSLAESGRWFHRRIDEEKARHGHQEPRHADEECHDLHAGACVETIFGGQPEKAVILYNRWARFAGYGLIELHAKSPLLLNIGDALLQAVDDTFKVIKCL